MNYETSDAGERMHPLKTRPVVKKEISELSFLFGINQIPDSSIDLGSAIHPILKAITRYTGIEREAIKLLNKKTVRYQSGMR